MLRFRWILLFALYTSQFFPVAFFFMGLPAILRTLGMDLSQISSLYLLGFLWVLKFFWAPLVDRFSFGRFGHYRVWLLLMQSGIVVSLCVISQLDGVAQFPRMLLLAALMTVFAATQDIATDAIACRLLPERDRGPGNAIQVAGGLLGVIIGGGAMLAVYDYLGWQGSILSMACLVSLAMLPILFFREHDLDIACDHSADIGLSRLISFWQRPGMGYWLLMLLVLNLGASIVFPLLHTRLVDIGWTVSAIGSLLNVIAPLISMLAAALTGLALTRLDSWRVLQLVLPLQAISILLLLPLAGGEAQHVFTIPGVVALFCMHSAASTAIITLMMSKTEAGTEGTDFSSQHSIYLLTGFLAGAAALQLASGFGYVNSLLIAVGVISAATLLCLKLRSRLLPSDPVGHANLGEPVRSNSESI